MYASVFGIRPEILFSSDALADQIRDDLGKAAGSQLLERLSALDDDYLPRFCWVLPAVCTVGSESCVSKPVMVACPKYCSGWKHVRPR